MKRDYLRAADFDAAKMNELFVLAAKMKAATKKREHLDLLRGHVGALVFQKPSLRTRVTFDVGLAQLGGRAIYLSQQEISLGERESVHDVAKNLERWVDIVIARVFAQSHVEKLARYGEPPVINALSDDEHPCQAMTDYFTLYERGLKWNEIRLAFIGDGNNVCTSLMVIGAALGVDMRVAGPKEYLPKPQIVEQSKQLAAKLGGKILVTSDWHEAVHGANAVYTDIWASMGQEHEEAERRAHFEPYQVNANMMKEAEPDALAMHDLPAHRGEEITDEVIDGPTSIVFDQAENRLHMQKAIILECMGLAGQVKL